MLLLVLNLAGWTPPAAAQPAVDPVAAFGSVCSDLNNEENLRRQAEAQGFQPAPAATATQILRGERGSVWYRQSPNGTTILISRPGQHRCEMGLQRADGAEAERQFVKLAEGIGRPEVAVTREIDREFQQDGRTYRQILYRLASRVRHPNQPDRAMTYTGSQSTPAPGKPQVLMSMQMTQPKGQ
ncbi:NMCC_0638 family (lipo)protein [Roseomonas elaeocarpi]|uniref:Lipoprotein n=1 Tax=Roseomonas elaeocarpi TaxID=907779 RepID=A0ABV6JUV3_9PROT